MLLFLVRIRGCGNACGAFTLLISACFPGCLHVFLPPAIFLALGAVGCKISRLILKQRGVTEAEPPPGVLVSYRHALWDVM